jgi:hypothetical protein
MKNKLNSILNFPFLVCLTILLLNDFYLKAAYPNWLTGKLSDFCGLVVFVWFWTALFPKIKSTLYFSTTLLFILWKSPYSQSFIEFFSQHFYPIDRVIDFTDLIALAILPMLFYYKPGNASRLKINPIPVALITVFAFCATSIPVPTQVFEQPQYILFKSGIKTFESSDYPGEYRVYNHDSLLIIDIRRISIDKEAPLDDEFHKVQILKDLDLRLIGEMENGYSSQGDLLDYKDLRDSLTQEGTTSITLKRDTITDELNFRNTRMDGVFKRYSEGNQLIMEGKYKNGIEDSIWTFYNLQNDIISMKYFEKGELVKTEIFEQSKLISERTFNTREEVIREKYFQLAIMAVLILGLLLKLAYNFRKSNEEDIIKMSHWSRIGVSLTLPIVIILVANLFSSIMPHSYTPFFIVVFGEAILVYALSIPVLLFIFYYLKLRSKFDLIYYILLFSLTVVLIEEWIYLRSIL